MDDIVLTEEDGQGYALPDIPHVEIIFDALDDTINAVAGVESLTAAQQYLQSVLHTSGSLHRSVTGVEGFFSQIGTGAKAAYDYVVKMLKQLWDFFFKRDAPKAIAEAKAEIKDLKAAVNNAEQGGHSAEESDKILDHAIQVAEEGVKEDGGDKAAFEKIVEKAKAAKAGNDKSAKQSAAKEAVSALPKLDTKAKRNLKGKHARLVTTVAALKKTGEDAASAEGNDFFKQFATVISQGMAPRLDDFLTKLKAIEKLDDIDTLKKILVTLDEKMTYADNIVSALRKEEGSFKTRAKEAEAALKPDATAEQKQTLEYLRKATSLTAKMAGLVDKWISAVKEFLAAGKKFALV